MGIDEENLRLLGSSPVFAGIPRESLPGLLRTLGTYARSYDKGEAVFYSGDSLTSVPVVLSGSIEARMLGKDGSRQIISRFSRGDSFAEAVPMASGTTPVEAVALEPTTVLFMPARVLKAGGDAAVMQVYANVMNEMTKKVKTLTAKLSILSEPRLRNRIIQYLHGLTPDADGFVTLPFSRKALAEYLAVNDKALLREFSRMRDEGLLEGEGRHLRLVERPRR